MVALSAIDFYNSTALDDAKLLAMFEGGLSGWAVGTIALRVRYTRSTDFSGTCFYANRRIHVNIGRSVRYPYRIKTHLARTRTIGRRWFKPVYTLELADAYELALFIFMHELYHLLVKKARRNTRQKESMCDRFAARHLVERFGRPVRDADGHRVAREAWDFQDLDGFVGEARDRRVRRILPATASGQPAAATGTPIQPLLFPL